MSRWMGWMMSMGLGGALMVGCGAQQASEHAGQNDPVRQKYSSPAAPAGQSGQTGQSGEGIATERGWSTHTAQGADHGQETGPYYIGRPQPVPRERQNAPFAVGGGTYNARESALKELKKY
jgi:hypothetical protein